MKFVTSFVLASAMVVAACSSGPSQTPEQRALKAANLAVWETRQTVDLNGKLFEYAVKADRKTAFIAPANSGFPYTPLELEAAARKATGCSATFHAGILEFLGGYSEKTDLRPIHSQMKSFDYWATGLAC